VNEVDGTREIASVLIIATDESIESLLGELVAFAGHRPIYDPTAGSAGESIRRVRPEVVMLDMTLLPDTAAACLAAARETGAQPILVSSTASAAELESDARRERCLYFPLPGAPRALARVVERALLQRPQRHALLLPRRSTQPIHPAFYAALAQVARARSLGLRVAGARRERTSLRSAVQEAMAETERSRAALRAAVTDYARQLRQAEVPLDRILKHVQDAIADCAVVVGAEAAVPTLLLESEEWTRGAIQAA
jgi:hypothetical protein